MTEDKFAEKRDKWIYHCVCGERWVKPCRAFARKKTNVLPCPKCRAFTHPVFKGLCCVTPSCVTTDWHCLECGKCTRHCKCQPLFSGLEPKQPAVEQRDDGWGYAEEELP